MLLLVIPAIGYFCNEKYKRKKCNNSNLIYVRTYDL